MGLADKYAYRIVWSEEDGEFVGTVAEFPSLSWLEPEASEALKGIRALVKEVVDDLEANGEPIPIPLSLRKFSGRFQVRIPPEQHRRLAMEAAEANVSLNRLVASKL